MLPARSLLLCSALLLSFAGTAAGAAEGEVVAGSVKEEGSCASTEAIEKIEPKYKPSQAALTAFFKLHEPTDANWRLLLLCSRSPMAAHSTACTAGSRCSSTRG